MGRSTLNPWGGGGGGRGEGRGGKAEEEIISDGGMQLPGKGWCILQ